MSDLPRFASPPSVAHWFLHKILTLFCSLPAIAAAAAAQNSLDFQVTRSAKRAGFDQGWFQAFELMAFVVRA